MVSSLEHFKRPSYIDEKSPAYHFSKWLKIKDRVKQYIKDYLKYFESTPLFYAFRFALYV